MVTWQICLAFWLYSNIAIKVRWLYAFEISLKDIWLSRYRAWRQYCDIAVTQTMCSVRYIIYSIFCTILYVDITYIWQCNWLWPWLSLGPYTIFHMSIIDFPYYIIIWSYACMAVRLCRLHKCRTVLQGCKAECEKAIRSQSNIALWQI